MKLDWSEWLEIAGDLAEKYVENDFKERGIEPWEESGADTTSFIPAAQDLFEQIDEEISQLLHMTVGELDDDVILGHKKFTITKSQLEDLADQFTNALKFEVGTDLRPVDDEDDDEPEENPKRGEGGFRKVWVVTYTSIDPSQEEAQGGPAVYKSEKALLESMGPTFERLAQDEIERFELDPEDVEILEDVKKFVKEGKIMDAYESWREYADNAEPDEDYEIEESSLQE